jgi:hypothetical protein
MPGGFLIVLRHTFALWGTSFYPSPEGGGWPSEARPRGGQSRVNLPRTCHRPVSPTRSAFGRPPSPFGGGKISGRARRVLALLAFGMAIASTALMGARAGAQALVTQGIGTSSCSRLAADLDPAAGLANPVNVMLYAWVQGFVSAANMALLEGEAEHIDMALLDGGKVVRFVAEYCKANPGKKPIAAVNELIRNAAKIKTRWETGHLNWDK